MPRNAGVDRQVWCTERPWYQDLAADLDPHLGHEPSELSIRLFPLGQLQSIEEIVFVSRAPKVKRKTLPIALLGVAVNDKDVVVFVRLAPQTYGSQELVRKVGRPEVVYTAGLYVAKSGSAHPTHSCRRLLTVMTGYYSSHCITRKEKAHDRLGELWTRLSG
jgi:hypothetical protein